MTDLTLFLLAGHMLGDWLVQSDHQATYKARPDFWPEAVRPHVTLPKHLRISWRANQAHVYTYHLTLLTALAYPLLSRVWSPVLTVRLLVAFALSWALHSLIDRRWPVRWLVRVTGSPEFARTTLGILAADQALHVATLALMAAVIS